MTLIIADSFMQHVPQLQNLKVELLPWHIVFLLSFSFFLPILSLTCVSHIAVNMSGSCQACQICYGGVSPISWEELFYQSFKNTYPELLTLREISSPICTFTSIIISTELPHVTCFTSLFITLSCFLTFSRILSKISIHT